MDCKQDTRDPPERGFYIESHVQQKFKEIFAKA